MTFFTVMIKFLTRRLKEEGITMAYSCRRIHSTAEKAGMEAVSSRQ